MKPLKSDLQDAETLRELGSASVQIVHDLKNQINGLKLYATFLRKRMEKSERPADELETISKLIAGLDGATEHMTLLVRLGRALDLRRQPGTDLARLLEKTADGLPLHVAEGSYEGAFDAAQLAEALQTITRGVRADGGQGAAVREVRLRRVAEGGAPAAIVEWVGAAREGADAEPFHNYSGATGLRMALAAKVIRAHDGAIEQEAGTLRARLPLQS